MDIAAAIAALSLAAETPAAATQAASAAACQTFTLSSPAAPEIVRWWLAHSRDDHVRVCSGPGAAAAASAEPQYSGESAISRSGAVCSYAAHILTPSGTGPSRRLQRYDRTEALAMIAVGDAACPPPHELARRYIPTYDLTPATFESLLGFWAAAAASADTFAHDLACCGAGGAAAAGAAATGADAASAGSLAAHATALRLRATIASGRMQAAAVTRVVRVAAHGLQRRYALFIEDPDSRPPGATVYVVYVSRWLRGSWHISGISDVAP